MPLFGGLILSLFTGFAEFFALYVTKKIAVGAAFVTVTLGFAAAMWAALLLLGSGITLVAPPFLSKALYLMNGSAAAACLAVMASAELTISAYRYQRETAKAIAYVT